MSVRLSHAEFAATQAKVEKINARAAKRGFTGRFEVVGEPVTETKVNDFGFEVTKHYVETTITGEAPKYNGWTFLATLDWDANADSLIVRSASDVKVDRSSLIKGHCDHCGTQRYRRNTYVVVSEAGEQKQVGSSCIKDFLGQNTPFVFITLDSVSEEAFGGGRTGDPAIGTVSALAIAWAAIRAFGYVRSGDWDGKPTKAVVDTVLFGRGKPLAETVKALEPFVAGSHEAAVEIRDFIVSDAFTGDSDYVLNLKAICAAEFVSPRNLGFLCSAPQAYAKAQERTLIRERERAATADSTFVGQKGDKVTVEGTIAAIRWIPGTYGTTVLYTIHGSDGNIFKWFASREALGEKDGVEVKISGTVKGHDEWNGQKSTVLTRCKAL